MTGGMITKHTAVDIALGYREIETAQQLLGEIKDAMSKRQAPDIRDAFGRLQSGLQLGLPQNSGHRLFDVPWSLAVPILEAHIAHHCAKIGILTQKARSEIDGAEAAVCETWESLK